jgi:predicted nucleic acid-binding protein
VSKLFIDTGAFLARELAHDQHHEAAVKGWHSLAESAERLFSSEHVLDETITLLARRESYAFAAECASNYLQSKVIEWLRPTMDDYGRAVKLMRKYADQSVSFTDCISFVLMRRESIQKVFGFDRHFQAAQFKLWPGR